MIKKTVLISLICLLGVSCNLNRTCYRFNGITMVPTIPEGSLVKITKDIDMLEYGDIILFNYDKDQYSMDEGRTVDIMNPLCFRIVGLPFDSLEIKDELCIVNGRQETVRLIHEERFKNRYEIELANGRKMHIYSIEQKFKDHEEYKQAEKMNQPLIGIPADHYFVMGDNRSHSLDSRYLGLVPRSRIIGKVIEITLPDGRIVSML